MVKRRGVKNKNQAHYSPLPFILTCITDWAPLPHFLTHNLNQLSLSYFLSFCLYVSLSLFCVCERARWPFVSLFSSSLLVWSFLSCIQYHLPVKVDGWLFFHKEKEESHYKKKYVKMTKKKKNEKKKVNDSNWSN